VKDCNNDKVQGTQACHQHRGRWERHLVTHKRQTLGGYRRALRRPDETWPWMPAAVQNAQPHDNIEEIEREVETGRNNPFIPPRYYCVETICAPCGVVVAWATFAKSESPTNILGFLEKVYPTEVERPAYVCIDKACLVLRTAVANGSWESWGKTTRFIVDSYHYVNHKANDSLCRRFCNPAPMDGSAPNLVVVERNNDGVPYYRRAFNTQACEQLNAWLGGFEIILKRMTSGNFNWFLHTLLFYHTKHVIERQQMKKKDEEENIDSDSDVE
jgi:hypothetical protein